MAILLISTDFLASDFIINEELPKLIDAMEQQKLTIISLILEPCEIESHPVLSQLQSVNSPDRPLSKLTQHQQKEVLVKLVKDVKAAVQW